MKEREGSFLMGLDKGEWVNGLGED